jgi:hypothetical protein
MFAKRTMVRSANRTAARRSVSTRCGRRPGCTTRLKRPKDARRPTARRRAPDDVHGGVPAGRSRAAARSPLEEACYVLQGEVEALADDETIVLRTGDVRWRESDAPMPSSTAAKRHGCAGSSPKRRSPRPTTPTGSAGTATTSQPGSSSVEPHPVRA